jgi:hypothetical protein
MPGWLEPRNDLMVEFPWLRPQKQVLPRTGWSEIPLLPRQAQGRVCLISIVQIPEINHSNENNKMSASHTSENVAQSLRPVVMVVVTAKIIIASFLFANVAGVIPTPATAYENTAVHLVEPN